MREEDFQALLERIRAAAPVLEAQAPANEARGFLTDEAFAALLGTGVLSIETPEELGGSEASPSQIIEALEAVSYADPSAGWVTMALLVATGITASHLDDTAVRELFAAGSCPLIAGQGNRMGDAVPAPGGFTLSGRWSFASGVGNATHLHSGAQVTGTDDRLIFVFPKEQASLEGNWDVMGLRATGSFDYSCTDLFVPESMTFAVRGKGPQRGGSLYRLGLDNIASIGHAGWALGVGRRLLDELRNAASAVGRTGKFASGQFHADFGRAEALIRSARALLLETWAKAEQHLLANERLDTELQSAVRLALYNTTWSAEAVSQIVYRWAGTAALRDGTIQRFYRDMHAGTQHVTSGTAVIEGVGEWYSGVSPEGSWNFSSFGR